MRLVAGAAVLVWAAGATSPSSAQSASSERGGLPRVVPVVETPSPEPARTVPPAPAFQMDDAPTPRPAGAPTYLIVPFGDPDDTDPLYRTATTALDHDLRDRTIRTALATPVDAIEAVGSAPHLCRAYRAAGLLLGQLTLVQDRDRDLTGLIPYVGGIIAGSGAFDSSPIRVRIRLFEIDCAGHVLWKTTTTANKVHHGTNVQAGLTQITLQAVNAAAEEFRIRPGAPIEPGSPAEPGAPPEPGAGSSPPGS